MDNSDSGNTAFRVLAWLILAFAVVLAVITTNAAIQNHASFMHWLVGILVFSLLPALGSIYILFVPANDNANWKGRQEQRTDELPYYWRRIVGKPERNETFEWYWLVLQPALFVLMYFVGTLQLHCPSAFTAWQILVMGLLGLPFGFYEAVYSFGNLYRVPSLVVLMGSSILLMAQRGCPA